MVFVMDVMQQVRSGLSARELAIYGDKHKSRLWLEFRNLKEKAGNCTWIHIL